jgi:hypothetical protein
MAWFLHFGGDLNKTSGRGGERPEVNQSRRLPEETS